MDVHRGSTLITQDDTRLVHRPSDRDVNWMSPVQESPPVQVKEKEPYDNLDMVTCRLSSCNSDLPIILERGSGSL